VRSRRSSLYLLVRKLNVSPSFVAPPQDPPSRWHYRSSHGFFPTRGRASCFPLPRVPPSRRRWQGDHLHRPPPEQSARDGPDRELSSPFAFPLTMVWSSSARVWCGNFRTDVLLLLVVSSSQDITREYGIASVSPPVSSSFDFPPSSFFPYSQVADMTP
jgi:hypothetical protein